jgi:MmyB-like transcription regulator ligand binding domain
VHGGQDGADGGQRRQGQERDRLGVRGDVPEGPQGGVRGLRPPRRRSAWTGFIRRLEAARPEFAAMWASQDVAQSASHAKLFRHPLGPFPGRFQHNRTGWAAQFSADPPKRTQNTVRDDFCRSAGKVTIAVIQLIVFQVQGVTRKVWSGTPDETLLT